MTSSVANALEIIHFLLSHKTPKSEQIKQFILKGIPKLVERIQFMNDFEASFLSSDPNECPFNINNRILAALIKFDPEVVRSHTQKFKGLQNYLLSKKKVISCNCMIPSFLGALFNLEKFLPVVSLDFSKPATTKISLTHAISGEAFKAESISSDKALKLISPGNFEGSFQTSSGEHNGQYTV